MSSESVDRCRAAASRDLVVVGEHLFHRDDLLYFPVVAFELGLMDWCTGTMPWLGRCVRLSRRDWHANRERESPVCVLLVACGEAEDEWSPWDLHRMPRTRITSFHD